MGGDKIKKYGKNWWISKIDKNTYFCPLCGKKPEIVLRGKHKLSHKTGEHFQVIYIECNHKEIDPDRKYNFPKKFRVEELKRFPRTIGEMKK